MQFWSHGRHRSTKGSALGDGSRGAKCPFWPVNEPSRRFWSDSFRKARVPHRWGGAGPSLALLWRGSTRQLCGLTRRIAPPRGGWARTRRCPLGASCARLGQERGTCAERRPGPRGRPQQSAEQSSCDSANSNSPHQRRRLALQISAWLGRGAGCRPPAGLCAHRPRTNRAAPGLQHAWSGLGFAKGLFSGGLSSSSAGETPHWPCDDCEPFRWVAARSRATEASPSSYPRPRCWLVGGCRGCRGLHGPCDLQARARGSVSFGRAQEPPSAANADQARRGPPAEGQVQRNGGLQGPLVCRGECRGSGIPRGRMARVSRPGLGRPVCWPGSEAMRFVGHAAQGARVLRQEHAAGPLGSPGAPPSGAGTPPGCRGWGQGQPRSGRELRPHDLLDHPARRICREHLGSRASGMRSFVLYASSALSGRQFLGVVARWAWRLRAASPRGPFFTPAPPTPAALSVPRRRTSSFAPWSNCMARATGLPWLSTCPAESASSAASAGTTTSTPASQRRRGHARRIRSSSRRTVR